MVSALAPLATASAAAPNCPGGGWRSGGVGSTYYSQTCLSGPGTYYIAVAKCSNNRTYTGQEARYGSTGWSTANCPSGYRVTAIAVGTR